MSELHVYLPIVLVFALAAGVVGGTLQGFGGLATGFMLAGLYLGYVIVLAKWRPELMPPLPESMVCCSLTSPPKKPKNSRLPLTGRG